MENRRFFKTRILRTPFFALLLLITLALLGLTEYATHVLETVSYPGAAVELGQRVVKEVTSTITVSTITTT